MAQRRELETALVRRAEALARQAGVSVSDSMAREAQETLGAALADPEVAAAVRSGRLVKPATYAGFGLLSPAAPPGREQAARITQLAAHRKEAEEGQRSAREAEAKRGEVAARREAEEKRAAELRRLRQARAALDDAAQDLAERTRAANAAEQRLEDVLHERRELDARWAELEARLRELEAERRQVEDTLRGIRTRIAEAEAAAQAAARTREAAEQAHAAARQALQEAEQQAPSSILA
jgi:uncharacterized protein (DUF3084 family)